VSSDFGQLVAKRHRMDGAAWAMAGVHSAATAPVLTALALFSSVRREMRGMLAFSYIEYVLHAIRDVGWGNQLLAPGPLRMEVLASFAPPADTAVGGTVAGRWRGKCAGTRGRARE
jgi:hypothetical protein